MGPLSDMQVRLTSGQGVFAALDQSGGSTPAALQHYGVAPDAFATEAQMFHQVHAMRQRIMTSPAFTAERFLGAILFVGTMDADVDGVPTPTFLWRDRGVVPFVKVDEGLEDEAGGVQLMKAMPELDATLRRAQGLGVFGTKARSVIQGARAEGVDALLDQQFRLAERVAGEGLLPILEPEVFIDSPQKAAAEALLRDALLRRLDALTGDIHVVLKLTLPETPDLYRALAAHERVARLVALSGGYDRDEACARLTRNHGMIASFSRALIQDLRLAMTEAEFDAALNAAAAQIYQASTHKLAA